MYQMKAIHPKSKYLLSRGYSINVQTTEILDRGCILFAIDSQGEFPYTPSPKKQVIVISFTYEREQNNRV